MSVRVWTIVVLLLAASMSVAQPGALRAERLRCEYLDTPLAIDDAAPRLSWIVTSDDRGQRQTAYRVLVATSPEELAKDVGDLWDSGRVETGATAHVEYAGKALASGQVCWWKVRSWDKDGREGAWSEAARWEMGLLAPGDWKAKWIEAAPVMAKIEITKATYATADGKASRDVTALVAKLVADKGPSFSVTNDAMGGDPLYGTPKRLRVEYTRDGEAKVTEAAENSGVDLAPQALPYLRRGFEVTKDVRRARLYVTALGVYEMSLNGQRVGDECLAPGWTDYAKRVRYQTFDVTSAIARGENVLGAMLGEGWFCGHAGLFNAHKYYGERPALLAQLQIEYADGTSETIVSDERWKSHAGPLLMADLLKGETFDARREIHGWNRAGLDDSAWTAARMRAEARRLEADMMEPVRAVKELPAKALTEPAPGKWTFDLGQNMVGVVRLRVRAASGATITIRHGEMLNPDGTLYTQNLRGATSTDTYICAGRGEETWTPRFTFHGFRYVEVTGLTEKPSIGDVTGVVLASDMRSVGTFECSDPRLNQLQSNIVWGLRGNHLSIPTDCPQRDERMGWMGDAQVFVPTAAMNADVAAFYTKWMTDVMDAQREDGAYCDTSPAMKGLNYGTPAWGDAGVIVPWVIYETYGDKRILERNIEAMIRWVDWCEAHSNGLIREKDRGNDYGDWLSIKADTPKDLIGTAYFAHSTDLVAKSLTVLGREGEAAKYRELFERIVAAFATKYVSLDGRVHGDTQSGYAIALRFGLIGKGQRADAVKHLVADIAARDRHLSTGFVGVSHLLHVLSDGGRWDVAHTLLVQDSFPSWLFSVKHGATTIWERWDGWTPEGGVHKDWGMNSFNHYSLGSCGRWMFESVAGIACDPKHPGFGKVVVNPHVGGTLTWAKGSYDSIRGRIESGWRIENGVLTIDVTVPANVWADVFVPTTRTADVRESGEVWKHENGNRLRAYIGGKAVYEVGSGRYSFTVPYAK